MRNSFKISETCGLSVCIICRIEVLLIETALKKRETATKVSVLVQAVSDLKKQNAEWHVRQVVMCN